ncbi:hypothetical protein KEM56_002790 [Ascosphaera pollenicola]|nr:hypothetical protein KEM56_002790 [Ascosphaera pollenicola]
MSAASSSLYQQSMQNPEAFWKEQSELVHWHKKPSRSFAKTKRRLPDGIEHDAWQWFPDGEISTSYNCLDRHVLAGNGDTPAIIWESPVTGNTETWPYKAVLHEVEVLAGVLREEGVKKGDMVLIYMPMIPAALFAILAIGRLGAVHSIIFGGFASASLAKRIESAKPRAIMTASCGIEGQKGPIRYKPLVEGAVELSSWKPERVIIWQREESPWRPVNNTGGQRTWQKLVGSAKKRGIKAEPVPVKSNEALYTIYTSGTTGSPKGIVREAGGHAVGLSLSIRHMCDINGPGDVMLCGSDIGWVVGHSYIVYGPLLAGATTIIFEGKPIRTPDAGIFWRIVQKHKVTILYTAPTALRAIKKSDPNLALLEDVANKGGLKTLKGIFLAGERSEPTIVSVFQDVLTKYGTRGARVVDNWWSSESGSSITGLSLKQCLIAERAGLPTDPVKPGSAGKPLPGFDVRIVDDEGNELGPDTFGNIVLRTPLAPTAFTTLYNDDQRFYKGYLKRFNGKWFDTGDAGIIDKDGYVHIMARSDDIINVAAHRFSTGAIEEVILKHPRVAEACVVGIPDSLKGNLPFAFIAPHGDENLPATPTPELFNEINTLIREQIGAIASLGGMVQGQHMIPRTRSGKSLRRVLRDLVANAVVGDFDKAVQFPPTIENPQALEVARQCVREYFANKKTQAKL